MKLTGEVLTCVSMLPWLQYNTFTRGQMSTSPSPSSDSWHIPVLFLFPNVLCWLCEDSSSRLLVFFWTLSISVVLLPLTSSSLVLSGHVRYTAKHCPYNSQRYCSISWRTERNHRLQPSVYDVGLGRSTSQIQKSTAQLLNFHTAYTYIL